MVCAISFAPAVLVDGNGEAKINGWLARLFLEMGDEGAEVGLVFGAGLIPVLGLGVVGAEFDNDDVGAEGSGVFEGLEFPVRAIAFFEESGADHSVVAHGVFFAKHTAEHGGIAVLDAVFHAGTEGNAIANAGDSSDGFGRAESCTDDE